MTQAKDGDKVKVHYTGTLENGTEFDSSQGREPLEFTLGKGQVIRGFESAVVGMNTGDAKTVEISEEDAYGARSDELVMVVEKKDLPEGLDPKVGEELELKQEEHSFVVRVVEADDKTVTLDANHPLAGEALTFKIELVEIG